jgi:eukaryotic-like serine/threonine-protein kinase
MTEGRHDMTAQPRLLGGRYQVGELLGYGGMAEVHRGRDLRLGRDVAIKTLRTDLARDATFQLRFRREAQNAASLNHPAIVAVYDTGEEFGPAGEELPYIVMEFVNGRTLKEVLAAEGRLMPRRALEITADICSAIEFSHRHGIIHRDIKPGNVMLTQTGQVKVMDFGIARALASGASTMTQTSAVIGTAQYLSPEQARGEAVDARSDVYATGCVLFELLTGHPPFVGDNPVSVAYQHVREDPRPPSASSRDVTPEIDAVVLKALAKNPLNRYQSAGEMRADLMRAAAGRPVSAPPVMTEDEMATMMAPPIAHRPPPPTRQVARASQRQRRKSSTPIVVVLTLLGLLAVTALAIGLYLANKTKMVPVPALVHHSATEADRLLADQGLRGDRQNSAAAGCPVNQVISQGTPAGQQVSQGTVIVYTVCVGPNQVKVPYVIGQDQARATSTLKDARLNAQAEPVDGDQPPGTVVGQDPKDGTMIAEGSTVKIQVSKGNLAKVPDLTGKTPDEAKKALRDAGFTANPNQVSRSTTDPTENGKVVGQDPAPNALKRKDAVIQIFIGKLTASPPPPSPSASASGT